MASYRLTALVILVITLLCVTPALGVQEVNDLNEFNKIIKSNAKVIVFYRADWSGPARLISPMFEKLAAEYASSIISIKVDVEEAPDIAAESDIKAMPTFKLYRGGDPIRQVVGANISAVKFLYASTS